MRPPGSIRPRSKRTERKRRLAENKRATAESSVRQAVPQNGEWLARITQNLANLTPAQRRLAEYASDNPFNLAFMTTGELANAVGVSEASIVRFARVLGYEGYPDLQREVRGALESAVSPAERLSATSDVYRAQGAVDSLEFVIQNDINSLNYVLHTIDRAEFNRAVRVLHNAHRVFVLAFRGPAVAGFNAFHYLNQVRDGVVLVDGQHDRLADQLMMTDEKSAILAIDFARYNVRTRDAVAFAKGRGAQTIVISDSLLAPCAASADILLRVSPFVSGFFRSHVASLSLINALTLGVTLHDPARANERLTQFESAVASLNALSGSKHVRGTLPTLSEDGKGGSSG
jgi:DNA-binding MurR/RpiR family transcriptional regulator